MEPRLDNSERSVQQIQGQKGQGKLSTQSVVAGPKWTRHLCERGRKGKKVDLYCTISLQGKYIAYYLR